MKIFFKSGNGYIEKDFSFNEFGNEKFQIVGDFQNSGKVRHSYNAMSALADNYEKDILVVNTCPSENLEIVKLIDMQKFLYEQKKAKKDQEKKQRALQMKNKEIRISLNISEHDLDMKVNHAKQFADEGNKVKFLLRLRGREGSGSSGEKYVSDFFKNVLSKFVGYTLGPVKILGNSYWTEVTK